MKCGWLKNESNYFVTCKYFQLIFQSLQTVARSTESTYKLQNNIIYNSSFICAKIFVFIYNSYIYIIQIYIYNSTTRHL